VRDPSGLNRAAKLFAGATIGAGVAVLGFTLGHLYTTAIDLRLTIIAILALVSGAAVLRLPSVPATFSFGDTFSFAALFLYGPAPGAVVAALDSLAGGLRLPALSRVQRAFNVAAPALSMWITGTIVFGLLARPLPGATSNLGAGLASAAMAACLFFFLETILVATVIALEKTLSPIHVWKGLFNLWLDPIVGAYVGFLGAFYSRDLGITFLLLMVPIPLILYHTFRTWIGRADDQIQHLEQMNRSYQSMIEGLATAVEAKDEVTHGHIRRVQVYCLALARKLGVTEPSALKALEAAAILHDVGKVGISERILNKPGGLTPAEFEEMKQHVVIGTHILSTIEFPFPVTPIVRHHHENWDGTGYPDGLAGEDIPLGARILMVVDCFDALTSDRPYRRRMSVSEAFDILRARRRTMYDACIVDAFIEVQPTIRIIVAEPPAPFPYRADTLSPVLSHQVARTGV
jgi:putative nucleotidyltransferase with HDIG domain